MPNPVYYFRDKIKEKLERQEMINRRKQILIPEFYVGKVDIWGLFEEILSKWSSVVMVTAFKDPSWPSQYPIFTLREK